MADQSGFRITLAQLAENISKTASPFLDMLLFAAKRFFQRIRQWDYMVQANIKVTPCVIKLIQLGGAILKES